MSNEGLRDNLVAFTSFAAICIRSVPNQDVFKTYIESLESTEWLWREYRTVK